MARCPFAKWTPIAATTRQPGEHVKTQVILHTLVAKAADTIDDWRRKNDLESTFIVGLDGAIYQLMDSSHRADANRLANQRAISIETEDFGLGRKLAPKVFEDDPNRVWVPWTQAQLSAIMRLLEWCHTAHGIPLDRCTNPTSPGVGYHSMWGTPSPWTPVTKTCPGPARVYQFDTAIQSFLDGREIPDQTLVLAETRHLLREVPDSFRQRQIVDPTFYLAPSTRKSTVKRRPVAGRSR